MTLQNSLSILIPAHNEEETILELATEISLELQKFKSQHEGFIYEIIILDDGSNDQTNLICLDLETNLPNCEFSHNSRPTGIFRAFSSLYAWAKLDWILLVPGDAQWRPDAVKMMLDTWAKSDFKCSVNSIREDKSSIYGTLRKNLSMLYVLFGSWYLDARVDPGSIKIVPRVSTKNLKLKRSVVIEIEILSNARVITGQEVIAVDTPWNPRISGKSVGASSHILLPSILEVIFLIGVKIFRK